MVSHVAKLGAIRGCKASQGQRVCQESLGLCKFLRGCSIFPKAKSCRCFCLLCSFLFPRCITITRGPHRRRCAQPQTLTAALFQRRVAEGEEDAHCDRHKLSIVQSGVKRRAPLLFELSHTEGSLLESRKKGRRFKGHLRA